MINRTFYFVDPEGRLCIRILNTITQNWVYVEWYAQREQGPVARPIE